MAGYTPKLADDLTPTKMFIARIELDDDRRFWKRPYIVKIYHTEYGTIIGETRTMTLWGAKIRAATLMKEAIRKETTTPAFPKFYQLEPWYDMHGGAGYELKDVSESRRL